MIPVDNPSLLPTQPLKRTRSFSIEKDQPLLINIYSNPPRPYWYLPDQKPKLSEADDGRYSVLHRSDPSPSLGGSFDDQLRLFAHIHSDTLIAGATDIEGNSVENTSSYMAKILPMIDPRYEVLEFIIMSDSQNVVEDGKKLTEKLIQLPSGSSILVAGGWKGIKGKSGHAILYEFVKNSHGTYSIFIYNTGDGTEDHQNIRYKNKTLIEPLISYIDVPGEEIFFNLNPTKEDCSFLQYLLRLRALPELQPQITINGRVIYKAFYHLRNYKAVSDQVTLGYMTAQRSGTCTWKVITAYLLNKLGLLFNDPKERLSHYKKIKCLIKLKSIQKFYQTNQKEILDNTPKASRAREILRNAACKLMRNAVKLYSPNFSAGIFSLDEAQTIYATGDELISILDKRERDIDNQRRSKRKMLNFEEVFSVATPTPNLKVSLDAAAKKHTVTLDFYSNKAYVSFIDLLFKSRSQ